MNGDWKDQKVNQAHQNDIQRQVAQHNLAKEQSNPLQFNILQSLRAWVANRKPLAEQSVALPQTRKLKLVK